MTTMTLESPTSASMGRLDELVDRLLATLFRDEPERTTTAPNLVKAVHDARRLRQAGDLDGALVMLADVETTNDTDAVVRWLYAEWLDIARRRFAGDGQAVLYSSATGSAAVLMPADNDGGDGALAVVAVLGMRWPVGKRVSRRSLRGLRPLAKGGE